MKTVWLVAGRGLQFFCFTRDDVGEAIAMIYDLMSATGDSVVDGAALDALDEALQDFNNPKRWMDGKSYWKREVYPRPMVEAWIIQPQAMAKALCTVGQRWLES